MAKTNPSNIYRNFTFYDGNTGETHHVIEWIDDGKRDVVRDDEMLFDMTALMRWSDDGGSHPIKQGKKLEREKPEFIQNRTIIRARDL